MHEIFDKQTKRSLRSYLTHGAAKGALTKAKKHGRFLYYGINYSGGSSRYVADPKDLDIREAI